MYVIIIGAGEVGTYLASILVDEGHDVAIVERDERLTRALESSHDALVVTGSGVNRHSLMQAGVKKADLVIAVTEVDEVNLVTCMIASRLGNKPRTVARVRAVEHYQEGSIRSEDMGLDLLVGPERSVADQVLRLLSFEGAGEIRTLAGGELVPLELPLSPDSPLVHESLAELTDVFPAPSLVAAISGDGGLRIPRGDDRMNADDRAEILTTPDNIDEFLILSGKPWHRVRHVLIIGCGTIGYQVAHDLESQGLYPTIIEADYDRAAWVSKKLVKSLVLHGDGTDPDLLREQLEEAADAVVVLLEDDEKSVLIGLFAKHLGAKKVIARSDKNAYAPIAHKIGIDALISPRRAVANSILHFVRRGGVERAVMLGDHEGEVLEIPLADEPRNKSLFQEPIKDLGFPRGSLVGGIIRGSEVLIPTGDTRIEKGDRLLIVATLGALRDVEELVR